MKQKRKVAHMPRRTVSRLPVILALVASLVIGGQIASILLQGKTVCLNGGCQVVEKLTLISPLSINLVGLGYFLVLAALLTFAAKKGKPDAFLPSLLLLAGAGIEGALLSYQQFAIRTFCSYCLTVGGFVLLLNLLHGWRQTARAALVFGGVVLASSQLNFGPALLESRNVTLQTGVSAVRPGEKSGNHYHLFVSATCPHCQKVLDALDRYPRCTVAINPISAALPEVAALQLRKTRSFSPEVNRLLLALLDIREIPVLLEFSEKGYALFKGENNILPILEKECSSPPGKLPAATDGQSLEGMSTQEGQQEGECVIDESCVGQ